MAIELSRTERALLSLDGLSVGDALGERYFGTPVDAVRRIDARELPPQPWRYTDDTEMALSIVEVLLEGGEVDQNRLAQLFSRRFNYDRGYGGGARQLLEAVQRGIPWQIVSKGLFGDTGSYGNGAAMRVAPLGAYFADDLDETVKQAERSALVTHAHPEGVAGAVAVAVAAAVAYQQSVSGTLDGPTLLTKVLERTPEGEKHLRITEAAALDPSTPVGDASRRLGSGQDISAQDTVPFVLWCAAQHLTDYEAAFWQTVSGLGDRDTTCAMVGGIVALSSRSLPGAWINAREKLPSIGGE